MPEPFDGEPEDLAVPPSFFPQDGDPEVADADPGELVQVGVEGVFTADGAGSTSRFVLLTDGERRLPISIGPFEAESIRLVVDAMRPDRPITHDLTRAIIERLGGELDRVVIDDYWNAVYYAKLYVKQGREEHVIDARPSDAVAVALRMEAPIFVADGLLENSDL